MSQHFLAPIFITKKHKQLINRWLRTAEHMGCIPTVGCYSTTKREATTDRCHTWVNAENVVPSVKGQTQTVTYCMKCPEITNRQRSQIRGCQRLRGGASRVSTKYGNFFFGDENVLKSVVVVMVDILGDMLKTTGVDTLKGCIL